MEFEENLQNKEEELSIMNNLMNNPCETEAVPIEEQLIPKYEKLMLSMKEEFERDIADMNRTYELQLAENMKETILLKEEIIRQREEIERLTSREGSLSCRVPIVSKPINNSHQITQEGKEKVLQNLLYKIKYILYPLIILYILIFISKYIDNNSIDNEITPANKKMLYEKVSARGDKKNLYSVGEEYNTISEQRRSTKDYTSREEELGDEEEIEDIRWLDNSIKNLNVRMNKM